jgi:ketosteroid isomerase-like protein
MALNKSMEAAFNANDMLKVASLYLDSAIISGGRSHISGRNNLDNYWLTLKDKSATWKLETDAIEDYGQLIIQRGRSYLTFSSNGVQRQSNVKFLLVWKKVDNSYRILYDYFSML